MQVENNCKNLKVPATPGKFLFTSPPPSHADGITTVGASGVRDPCASHLFVNKLSDTPLQRKEHYLNPFTSTPMSVGCVGSYAESAGAAPSVQQAGSIAPVVHTSHDVPYELRDAAYVNLDLPPKTPGANLFDNSPEKDRDVDTADGGRGGSDDTFVSPDKMAVNCSTFSAITAPAEEVTSRQQQKALVAPNVSSLFCSTICTYNYFTAPLSTEYTLK